ncbi:MAG: hypothetical protein GY755_23520 [Chloroflexi bacterium]|nr:hypothetical protein [Chloroflexota bacterium]
MEQPQPIATISCKDLHKRLLPLPPPPPKIILNDIKTLPLPQQHINEYNFNSDGDDDVDNIDIDKSLLTNRNNRNHKPRYSLQII